MNSDSLRRRTRRGLIVAALAVCALPRVGQPGRARAQAPAEAQAPMEYRELIEQALIEFKHKNWPEARVLFRRAHELSPNARTLRGMGVVSYEMRDYVNALIALSGALADSRQPLTEAQRKECEALLTRARTFVGAYALKLEPREAEVRLDGAALVRDAEGRVLVPFGEHTLHASAPGYQESTSKLLVQGGEQGELRVVLYPPERSPAAPVSSIEKSVRASAPAASEPSAPPPATGFVGHGVRYAWVTLATGAALGGAAAAVWYLGERELDDQKETCARAANAGMPCLRGELDTTEFVRYERTTNALLGLAGGALVATIVLLSVEWPRERRPDGAASTAERAARRKLALEAGPRQLSLRGTF